MKYDIMWRAACAGVEFLVIVTALNVIRTLAGG